MNVTDATPIAQDETTGPEQDSPAKPKNKRIKQASDDDDEKGIAWRATDEIRHTNLVALRAHYRTMEGADLPDRGSLQRFADYVGISARYIGHIERKKKRIGRRIADHLEKKFHLPPGWMDVDRGDGTLAFDPEAREFAELAMKLFLRDRAGVRGALMRYMAERLETK